MSENTYAVVFTGQLIEGANAEQVMANFARLFRVELARVEPMFTGKPVTIKKGLDEAGARKYEQALRQAGALCQVVDLATAGAVNPAVSPAGAAAPAQSAAAQAASAVTALNATLAEPGALLKEPEQVESLQIETAHLSMGEVGEQLVQSEEVAEPQIDISQLSMAEAGVQLVAPSNVTAPEIDVSALTLAEPGVVLQESSDSEPLQIDISGITLA